MLRTWRKMAVPLGAIVIIVLDQLSKRWVRLNIPVNVSWQPIPWLDPIFTFTHIHNTGAAFGLFGGMNTVFIVLALVVIVAILVIYHRIAAESWVLRLALTLQLGGATGNLIDRIRFGYVIDFINFRWWPIWNIADGSIVVGTVLLAIYALFIEQSRPMHESAQTQNTDDTRPLSDATDRADALPPEA